METEQMSVNMMQPKQMRAVFSRIGFGVALFVGLQQLVVAGLFLVVSLVAPGIMATGWFTWVASYGALYLVGFPVLLLVIKGLPNYTGGPQQLKKPGVGSMVVLVMACIGIVFLFNMASILVSTLVESIRGTGVSNPAAEMMLNSNPWVNYIFVALVAPIMEEIIFRHILYKKLIVFGGKAYVLFSALVFGLMHPNMYQFFYALILGVLFGMIVYFTGSIKYTIIIHMVINTFFGGGSPLLLAYFGTTAVEVWSTVLLLLGIVGLVLGIVWFVRKRKSLEFAPAAVQLPGKGMTVLNPGMMVYILMMVGIMLLTLLA